MVQDTINHKQRQNDEERREYSTATVNEIRNRGDES